MALLQHPLEVTLSIPVETFNFTEDEFKEIKNRIKEFEIDKKRTGGSALLKELEKVEYFKKGLLEHVEAIRDILEPKKRERTSVKEAVALAQESAIKTIASTFSTMDEKLLRQFGQSVLGDSQLDYTASELPWAIAHKQVTGELLECR